MITVQCCGKVRATQFCPRCGKRLGDDTSLGGLVSHCRVVEKNLLTRAAKAAECPAKDHPAVIKHRMEYMARAAKWKDWGDTLAALIGGDDEPE
jgi:NMD protein affecting ribosome stability and mRNA decay